MTAQGDQTRADILAFIQTYVDERGYSPSVREIADGIGRAVSVTHGQLVRLQAAGLVARADRTSRTWRVVERN